MKAIIFASLIFVSAMAIAQDPIKPAPGHSGEEVYNPFKYHMLPFWGHIQQYKVSDSTIVILFPDNHAEKFVNGVLKETIKCKGFADLYVKRDTEEMICSKNVGWKGPFEIKFGFSKPALDYIGRLEKLLGCALISIEKIANGFSVNVRWQPQLDPPNSDFKTSAKYTYTNTKNNYITVHASRRYPPSGNNNATDILISIRELDSEPATNNNPCEYYADHFLQDTVIKCPYYFINREDNDDPQFGTIREQYNYLFSDVIFDYSLPHQTLFGKEGR